jgi:uncharacterized protein with PQ loop repeat
MKDITQFVGIGAAILTAVAMLPQLIKVIREKKSEGVSIYLIAVFNSSLDIIKLLPAYIGKNTPDNIASYSIRFPEWFLKWPAIQKEYN